MPPTGGGGLPGMPYNPMTAPMMNYPGVGYPSVPPPPYNPMQYPGMHSNTMAPPMVNYNSQPGVPQPSYPMQYPGSHRDPRFVSYPRHRRRRVCVYRGRSSHSRPIVRMIRSDSCDSISTCSSISSCSRRCHRSYSYSESCSRSQQPQQQQQPIILLPIQCQQQQQQQPAIKGPVQGQIQPMILPSTQVQQNPIALPTVTNLSATPIVIQPLNSMGIGQPRQIQAGPIQYVQSAPRSQIVSVKSSSSIPSKHVLVNSTNNTQPTIVKPIPRSATLRN